MQSNPSTQNPFPGPADVDGYQRVSGSCSTSESIHLYSGNLICEMTLVSVPTVSYPLGFNLTYNSLDASAVGPIGYKWRHNYMMSLAFTGTPVNYVKLMSDSGRQTGFVQSGGTWSVDTASYYYFFPGTLSQEVSPSTNWRISYPDGSYMVFNSSGQLTSMVDPHGNTTTLAYSGGNLSTITEPTGRQISLSYTGSLLTQVTDPRGNATTLGYDTTNNNLTSVTAPTGCVTSYAYATPGNHLITSKTDPLNHVYTYAYTGNQLNTVTDGETPSHTLTYTYDLNPAPYDTTNEEEIGYNAQSQPVYLQPTVRTLLTDARGKAWEYRFDLSGLLWRVIDPLNHWTHYFWDSNQKLLSITRGFRHNVPHGGHLENVNNIYYRADYDANGNLAYETNMNGRMDAYTYATGSNNRQLLTKYIGQADLRTQGHWVGNYGSDGYILCAFASGSSDVQSLAPYVSSATFSGTLSRVHDADTAGRLEDPRTPVDATSLKRGLGYWKFPNSGSPLVTIALNQAKQFNLSIYTNSTDLGPSATSPFAYYEQTGYDVKITVTDQNGTQTFEVHNNAQGAWVTFPVKGDQTHSITVTVSGMNATTGDVRMSAMTFDPLESHKTTYGYNATSDLTSMTDPLGNQTTWAFNSDGTVSSVTDALSNQTSYFYEDAYKNRTRVRDALGKDTRFAFDKNSNVLSVTDPNANKTTYVYDAKNRPTSVTDALGNQTAYTYNNNGDLWKITDPNGNITQFLYTASNRLWKIIDPLTNTTIFGYDGAGNLTSVTDPRTNVTAYAYDDAGRMTQVTLPDNNVIKNAYDSLDRLRAVTTQNGNQATLANVNVTNAANWLQNPGAESADPNTPTAPRYWTASPSSSGTWDTAVSHSGTHSLKLAVSSATRYWTQANIPLPPGVSALVGLWARPDGSASASTVQTGANYYNYDGTVTEALSATTTLPASSTAWLQTPPSLFTIPGDSQAGRFPMTELRTYGASSGTPNAWYDDFTLFAVSTAFRYDGEGQLLETLAPDGARTLARTDRYGRVVQRTDARGNTTILGYDALDRITKITDPLGNFVTYAFDAVGRMISFGDQKNNQTQYAFDNVNRLTAITYPDQTTEAFGYDAAGRMATYTNNRGQKRTFTYDAANRLVLVTYSDGSNLSFLYDAASRLIWRVETDGTRTEFFYDAANRLKNVEVVPTSSGNPTWVQNRSYDANGNETEFDRNATSPVYNTAVYNTDAYAAPATHWSVPASYTPMNLMPSYKDRNNNQTSFSYDVESRRSQIAFPNGTPAITTIATFDITGHLVALATASASSLLSLAYGYDLASNRVAMVANSDTFDYRVDAAGQLLEESINRMVEQELSRFSLGSVSQVDVTGGALSLLAFNDSLTGTAINTDRWRVAHSANTFVGQEVRENGALQFTFPKGYSNKIQDGQAPIESFGLVTNTSVYLEHRTQLTGDFDVQVDFASFQATGTVGLVGLMVTAGSAETANTYALMGYDQTNWRGLVVNSGSSTLDAHDTAAAVTSGTLRITRTGSNVILYKGSTALWSNISFTAASLYVSLYFTTQSAVAAANLSNFTLNSPATTVPASGTYTSAIYDAGRSVTWNQLSWNSSLPAGTSVQMDVQAATSSDGSFTITGTLTNGSATVTSVSAADISKLAVGAAIVHANFPSGTTVLSVGGTSFTVSNNATANATATAITVSGWTSFVGAYTASPDMLANISGRYFRYRATLNANGAQTQTPTVSRVDAAFGGTTLSQVIAYSFDACGNLTLKTTDSTAIVTGSTTSGSATVSGVSAPDIANVTVGAVVAHANFPSGTTVSTVGANSFTVSNNATQTSAGVSIGITGTSTATRQWTVTGTLTSGSSTVSSVSTADLNKLAVGFTVQHANFPAGTYVVSKTSTSFTVNNNATASATGATISATSVNKLNQILRNDVTPAGGTSTTWTYTFDNTGNLSSKTDGTNTTNYTWNEDNRLTQVGLPGGRTITYTYDSVGRMLTRADSSVLGTATFEWDGMDMVAETAADGTLTRYYIPNGEVLSFERSGSTYQVHADALGHVRLITDSTGATKFSAGYAAWGNTLFVTDNVPNGGWNYRYVGVFGVRADLDTGLTYMRQRWYDPQLQRFVGRDKIGGGNRYAYVNNAPTNLIDPMGLEPVPAPSPGPPAPEYYKLGPVLDYLSIIAKTSRGDCPHGGVPLEILCAVLSKELDYGKLIQDIKLAIVGKIWSPENVSVGLGQIKPSTAAMVDAYFDYTVWTANTYYTILQNPATNIRYTAEYIRYLFENIYVPNAAMPTTSEGWAKVMSAYNTGLAAAKKFKFTDYDADMQERVRLCKQALAARGLK